LAGPALAVQFEYAPFGHCVEAAQLPGATEIVGYLNRAGGDLKGASYTKTDALGRGRVCFPTALIPGDRVRVTSGASSAQTVVPGFTLAVDRVTDVVSGRMPRSTTVKIETFNPYTSTKLTRNVVSDATGRFSTDFTPDYNINGGDRITASFRDTQGHLVTIKLRAPFMTIWLSSPSTTLALNPDTSAQLALKNAGGSVIAETSGAANAQGTMEERIWRNAGRVIVAQAGQRVTGDFAPNASISLPVFNIQVNATSDVVTGRCVRNALYRIELRGASDLFVSRVGLSAAADGSFSENFTGDFDIEPLDTATVYCRFATGDEVVRSGVAP
jgi:hypothetical protein